MALLYITQLEKYESSFEMAFLPDTSYVFLLEQVQKIDTPGLCLVQNTPLICLLSVQKHNDALQELHLLSFILNNVPYSSEWVYIMEWVFVHIQVDVSGLYEDTDWHEDCTSQLLLSTWSKSSHAYQKLV